MGTHANVHLISAILTHHALDDLAEDDVSAVEPGGLLGGDEKLGSVGILASVGHGQPPEMLQNFLLLSRMCVNVLTP